MVKVSDENGISVGELPVETNVNDSKKPLVNEATIVVLDLNVLVLVEAAGADRRKEHEARIEETVLVEKLPPQIMKPARKSFASKIGVLSALTLVIVAGATMLFRQEPTILTTEISTPQVKPEELQKAPEPAVKAPTQEVKAPEPKAATPEVKPEPPAAAKPSEPSPQKKFTNTIGMEFILIPAGSFKMGSTIGGENAKPHEVNISKSLYLQTTEVSQGQWKKVMGDNPSSFKECGDDCPVENVSWDDIQRFIGKLNQLEKPKGYRLPSEAEWEYACRAGTTTEYSFGDDSRILGEYAWYLDNSNNKTHRVATRTPNPWGLYDMHGNVGEWVEDEWHGSYQGAPADGRAWVVNPGGSARVVRGGGWINDAQVCRSATRCRLWPGLRGGFVGFRLSRSVSPAP